ncbi:MAG: GDP-L-fucose synthase family protein [Promethearchaeota archaeon]|jgi:GDP-L-fucose synthase
MYKRILITGGSGMVGYGFKQIKTDHDLILVNRKDADLLNYSEVLNLINSLKPDAVIHLAAKVGGIKANMEQMGDFYNQNIIMNTNVLNACKELKVKKVLSLLSTCVYPDNAIYPLTEDQIHSGKPHDSNYAYAYAKRMLDVQSRSYRKQFGCNFITAIPNNLFGNNDNYHLNDSHVIPAIMHKMYKAKTDVKLWGDGNQLREFTYSQDLAKILLFLIENYNDEDPINVGNTQEHSIKSIAIKIKKFMNFQGQIIWDTSKPAGQFRKPSSNSKLLKLGWKQNNFTDFDLALQKSCDWFIENYPNVRGIK